MVGINVEFVTAAENAVMLTLVNDGRESSLSIANNELLHKLASWLRQYHADCIADVVPSYSSLLIYYDALSFDEAVFIERIRPPTDWFSSVSEVVATSHTHVIRVCYDSSVAPDLQRVAQYAQLTTEAVITAHQQPLYHVYALGFAPGFAYLGDVPEAIRCPRLETPRANVPRYSVAIANQQTSVYPSESPGGWNLIGQVVELPRLKAGDKVRFQAISLGELKRLRKEGR
ncbi:MAG TPA: allophanate hydrolase subunit 1 [Pseudidiomarina sp.]|nr:allophanate hydrolase subunit 1 [Pseudidiomarina sp.]